MADKSHLDRLARQLVDSGQPVAAGFMAARLTGLVPADATPDELERYRVMFMMGAQHLWGLMNQMLDEDREPTDADTRRMSIIHGELEQVFNEMAKTYGLPPHPTDPRSGRA